LNVLSGHLLRRATFVAGVALVVGALGAVPIVASAAPSIPGSGRTLPANTRFYVPPPAQGSVQQELKLLLSRQVKEAGLIAAMEATPQAVWLDGETSAEALHGNLGSQQADLQVQQQVRQTMFGAALERAVPVLVAYNIPGRDCSQYSAGGAPSDAAYDAWINSLAQGLGNGKAVVILEPDALANLPSDCSPAYQAAAAKLGITDATREADVAYGVTKLETDPNASVYIDGGHSAWQNVGDTVNSSKPPIVTKLGIAHRLVLANVVKAQGFFLDVSNYQCATNNVFFGTWVSDCIAYTTVVNPGAAQGSLGSVGGTFANNCPGQYWNGGPSGTEIATLLGAWTGVALSPYGVWSETTTTAALNTSGEDAQYAGELGATVPASHFVIDTSRDGLGPNNMATYAATPDDQDSGVIAMLQAGNWCNPPGSGTGILPTANTAGIPAALNSYQTVPSLLDAYLWVKTPGQSDGQCDAAGGVRTWSDTEYTPHIAGWPAITAGNFQTFDPLWSLQTGTVFTDPAAGAWFPQQALQLAENAKPALRFP
jgi:endoglucanase